MIAILKAFFAALLDALRDWQREGERDALVRSETAARNDLEDKTHDQENADRITRAVDAVRSDGLGGVRGAGAGGEPDTRGYRD